MPFFRDLRSFNGGRDQIVLNKTRGDIPKPYLEVKRLQIHIGNVRAYIGLLRYRDFPTRQAAL